MSSKKKDEEKIDHSLSETKNPNNIQVYRDPLFNIGDIVKHRIYPFRGVIVDVDPEFSNTEEWYQSIPAEITPKGAVRSAQHEDINLITLLVGATADGLQVMDHDGTWIEVEGNHDHIIVDSGDMLQNLTNG